MRDIRRGAARRADTGDARSLVLEPADAHQHHASNALLKTLEEPAGGATCCS